jgi:hypothetical protein
MLAHQDSHVSGPKTRLRQIREVNPLALTLSFTLFSRLCYDGRL